MSRKGQQTDEDKTGDSGYTFQQQRELFEMQIALEREKAKLSVEAAKETADAQYKVLQMQIELERQKQLTEHNNRINPAPLPPFNVRDATGLLPMFNDTEIETYLVNFEKLATANAWPKRHWANILIPVLKGNKAIRAFNRLDANTINNYDELKTAVLEEYSLVPEVYRAHFRNCVRRQNDSYADYSVYLLNQFERWVNSMQVAESYDNLKQLMLVEQFMNKISDDLREHLIDKGCHTLQDCARKADEYIALHKSMKHGQRISNNAQPKESNKSDISNSGKVNRVNSNTYPNQTFNKNENYIRQEKQNSSKDKNYLICHYCHKPGHVIKDCYARKRDNEKQVGFVTHYDSSMVNKKKSYSNYVHSACVCCVNGNGKECVDISSFRDTGAEICLLREGAVPEQMLKPVNRCVKITGILGSSEALDNVPVYSIHVKSVFAIGEICVALVPSTCNLPNDVQLLIGNDYGKTMTIENGVNNSIVGAVTRSQTAKEVKLVQETCVDKVVGADIPDQGVPGTSEGAHTNNILDDESLAESLHNLYDKSVCLTDNSRAVNVVKLGELQKQETTVKRKAAYSQLLSLPCSKLDANKRHNRPISVCEANKSIMIIEMQVSYMVNDAQEVELENVIANIVSENEFKKVVVNEIMVESYVFQIHEIHAVRNAISDIAGISKDVIDGNDHGDVHGVRDIVKDVVSVINRSFNQVSNVVTYFNKGDEFVNIDNADVECNYLSEMYDDFNCSEAHANVKDGYVNCDCENKDFEDIYAVCDAKCVCSVALVNVIINLDEGVVDEDDENMVFDRGRFTS